MKKIFAFKKMNELEKAELIRAINADDYQTVKILRPRKIHIGIFRSGFKFSFNCKKLCWGVGEKSTMDGIKSVLDNYAIYDDEGDQHTADVFWAKVQEAQTKMTPFFGKVIDGYHFLN